METSSLRLDGRAAIVTGAAQGIGRKIAHTMAKNGARVLGVDLQADELETVCTEINTALGTSACSVSVTDVSDLGQLDHMIDTCLEQFGRIDILVNNAGILHTTPIEDVTEAEWDRIMAVNLKSVFFASQKVLPFMKERGWGRIINMSSVAGRMGGYANGLAYSASKAGIIGLSRGFARRIGGNGITVNAVAPGTIDSGMTRTISDEMRRSLREMMPVGRLGEADDIANLVLFLASELSGFITGAVVDINGGMYMG